MILLCSATKFEIQPTIDATDNEDMRNVRVLITGIGLTAATYSITRAVLHTRPRFILQAGLGGTLDPSIPLAKVVLVKEESIGDLGVEENGSFRPLFQMGLPDEDDSPWVNGILPNDLPFMKESGLTIVKGVTLNEISTSTGRIRHYREKLGASVESMEGAALHYVALREKIPFLQMRSLSNFAGERDKSRWKMEEAISTLNFELLRLLKKLES